jgi:hypothetical protein
VAYKWLSDLKGKGCLGSSIVRKSLLDDRQGERYQFLQHCFLTGRYELLLLSLSSHILRLRLPKRYPESKRLVLSSIPDVESLRVHCLSHTYQLSRNARRRKQIYQETQSFATLLREKDRILSEKERTCKHDLDVDLILHQCQMEEARWERSWTTIKNEWILDTLQKSLSPIPPIDFFSQSYQEAFTNHKPSSKQRSPTTIQASSKQSETNIANLFAMDKQLSEEIAHLETTVTPPSSINTTTTPSPRRKSASFRKSLPPTPLTTPSPSPEKSRTNAHNLRFTRSSSRLSQSSSESPRPLRRMASDHCTTSLENGANGSENVAIVEECVE